MSSDSFSVCTFSNLEELLAPFYYEQELEIPPAPPGTMAVPSSMTTQSRLSDSCLWGYIFNGPVIRCFPVSNINGNNILLGRGHVALALSTVGYHFPNSIIKCAVELDVLSPKWESGIRKLLLGLDCGPSGGLLVIYDPVKGQPMRWIAVPAAVESVAVISHFEEDASTDPVFNEAMLAMVGIAAVALAGGEFIIVDLALDELRKDFQTVQYTFEKPSQRENTFQLVYVQPNDELIIPKRRHAVAHQQLICIDFHSQNFPPEETFEDSNLFYYCDASGELLGAMKKQDVHITAMSYFPAIGSIVIGFNFGCFQIWRVDGLQLEYSSPFDEEGIPVHSFEFQTPIDDPRNFCYIWVLFGLATAELSQARVELISLEYDTVGREKTIYTDLKSCMKRLNFYLQDCYSLNSSEESLSSSTGTPVRLLVRPMRMWTQPESLLFISWEASRDGVAYLGVFDLNQWYSAQTPGSIPMLCPDGLSPFWVAFPFGNPGINSGFEDVKILPKTFQRWHNSHIEKDVHFFPASITFQAMCLSLTGTYTFEHFGIQEKLIRLIQKEGYSLMADPGELRAICENFGLSPYFNTIYPETFSQNKIDQFYIMSVILECQRPALIVQMANRWLDGSFENLGLNLNLIMEWINSLTTVTRVAADAHWELVLNVNTQEIPPDTHDFLNYSNFIWNQHKGLLWTLLRPLPFSEDKLEEHYNLKFAIERLVQYSATLIMLHRAKILPVSPTKDFTETMKSYYAERRETVKAALDNCQFLHSEERGGHPLLIDYLFENLEDSFIRQEWDLEPGEPIYPPKHPGYMINLFLGNWINIPLRIISRIIFYYMLDLIQYEDNSKDLKGDFDSIITLSQEEQKDVGILWMIDHGEFPAALSKLSRVQIDAEEREGFPWSAAMVILAAQGYEKAVLNILTKKSYHAKISKFAFTLACELEPNSEDILSGMILSFWQKQPAFFCLLEMADQRDLFDELILRDICRSSKYVQSALIDYLEYAPKTIRNQLRLLRLHVSTENLSGAIEHYKTMFREWRDRRSLREIDQRAFEHAEVELKKLILLKGNNFGQLKLRNKQEMRQKQAISVISNVTSTPTRYFSSPDFILVPPQLRRLMKDGMETSAGLTPLSPLRRYVGRMHRRESEIRKRSSLSHSFVASPKAAVSNPFATEVNNDQDSPSSDNGSIGSESSVNLQELLRTPPVISAGVTAVDNESPNASSTPRSSSFVSSDSQKSQKSIMKKKGKPTLRNSLLRTRFLNMSATSSTSSPPANCVDIEVCGDSDSPKSGSTLPFSPQDSPPSELNMAIVEPFSSESDQDNENELKVGPSGVSNFSEYPTEDLPGETETVMNFGEFNKEELISSFDSEVVEESLSVDTVTVIAAPDCNILADSTSESQPEIQETVCSESMDMEVESESEVCQASDSLTPGVDSNETSSGTVLFSTPPSALNEAVIFDSSFSIVDISGVTSSGNDASVSNTSTTTATSSEKENEQEMEKEQVEISMGSKPDSENIVLERGDEMSTLTSNEYGLQGLETEKIDVESERRKGIKGVTKVPEEHGEQLKNKIRKSEMEETLLLITQAQSSTQESIFSNEDQTVITDTQNYSNESTQSTMVETVIQVGSNRRHRSTKSTSSLPSSPPKLSTPTLRTRSQRSLSESPLIPDAAGGIVTRSRSRHLSEMSELDEMESTSLNLSTQARRGSDNSFSDFSFDQQSKENTRSSRHSMTVRAQSEPCRTSTSTRPRRKSDGIGKNSQSLEPSTPTPPRTRYSSHSESILDFSMSQTPRRGKRKAGSSNEDHDMSKTSGQSDSSINSLANTSFLDISVEPVKRRTRKSHSGDNSFVEGRAATSSRALSEQTSEIVSRGRGRPRKSSSEPPQDLDNSQISFSLNMSMPESEDGEEFETSLQDTSFTDPRRKVFDYKPNLSTVLELSENSTQQSESETPTTSTPMTPRTRLRRSLRLSIPSSVPESEETEMVVGSEVRAKEAVEEKVGGRKKRKRNTSASSSIASIEEVDEDEETTSPKPEPRRLRRDSEQVDEGESDTSVQSNVSNTSGNSKKTRTRTTRRKNV